MFKEPVKIIVFALLLAFWASLLITKIELPQGNDIARHVKNGDLILHGNSEVLYSNLYSYTMPDQPFVNHHWLSGVIFYLIQSTIGWDGLVIFKMLILLGAFILLFMIASKKSDFWLAAIFSIPAIFLLAERTQVRPEIFSILFVVIYLYLLLNFEINPRKKIYWIVTLQVLWVNMHIFFVYGIAIVAVFLFEKIIQLLIERKPVLANDVIKKLFLMLGLQLVACILNPNGIKGALFPFKILSGYGFEVLENEPLSYFLKYMPMNENTRVIICIVCIIVLAISFILNFRKPRISYLILSIISIIGGINTLRVMPFFGLIFLPAVCINFRNLFAQARKVKAILPLAYRTIKYMLASALSLLLVVLTYEGGSGKILSTRLPGFGLTEQSQNAANFFKSEGLKGPVFNDYDIGGYLIYNLYPTERVFTDNRPEAYSENFFKNGYWLMLEDESTWQKADAKYKFNVLFFEQYDLDTRVITFLNRRISDSTWTLVFTDRYAMMFVRNAPENQNTIAAHAITLQNVQEKLEPMIHSDDYRDQTAAADILNFIGRPDLGMTASFDIVTRWPYLAKTWKVMGQIELSARGDYTPILAMMFLDKAITEGYRTADAYTSLAMAFIKLGKMDRAKEALEKAIKINPEYPEAKTLMAQYFKK
jgi:tetratricopeptide (TPR) repeat protein